MKSTSNTQVYVPNSDSVIIFKKTQIANPMKTQLNTKSLRRAYGSANSKSLLRNRRKKWETPRNDDCEVSFILQSRNCI